MFGHTAKILCLCAGLAASTAAADPATDGLVSLLKGQGFSDIQVTRTWLGRVRIEAKGNNSQREIVINPRTGEILRDFWTEEDEDGNRHSALIARGTAAEQESSGDTHDDGTDGGSDGGGNGGGGHGGNDGGGSDDGDSGGGDDGSDD